MKSWIIVVLFTSCCFSYAAEPEKPPAPPPGFGDDDHKPEEPGKSKPRPAELPPKQKLPKQQEEFLRLINSFADKYAEKKKGGANELQLSKIASQRGDELKSLAAGKEIKNWIGTVKRMETTRDGNATLQITVSEILTLQTAIGNLDDALSSGSSTLIPQESLLYHALENLNTGDRVIFSGMFFVDTNKLRGLRELSVTENGSMTDPAFSFKFTDVKAAK